MHSTSRQLHTALRLWFEGEAPIDILNALPRRRSSEAHRLASWAHLALEEPSQAWLAGLEADLARLPFWIRPFARRRLLRALNADDPHEWRATRILLRLAPTSGRLWHRWAELNAVSRNLEAFTHALDEGLPWLLEDPIALNHLRSRALELLAAPSQASPEAQSRLQNLADRIRDHLLHRHGDPRLHGDHGRSAAMALEQGDPLKALSLLWNLPLEARSQMHWETLVMALRALNLTHPADQALDQALKRYPHSSTLWIERYLLDLLWGRSHDARRALDRAHACILHHERTSLIALQRWHLHRASFALYVEHDPALAWEHLQHVPLDLPDAHATPLRIQVQLALGDAEGAYTTLRPLLRERPEDLGLRMLEMECLAALEAWDSLAEHLRDLPEVAQNWAKYWHLKGLAAAHREDWEQAREALEKAAAMDPSDLRLVLDAGHACLDLHDYTRAEMHWRRALTLDPQCAEALVQWAETLFQRQDLEGAKRLLRECLVHHPDHLDAQTFLAELEAH